MKRNKVLLVNPWIYDFAAYDFWIKPVGLLSIGCYLEKHGYETYLIDCMDRFQHLIPTRKKSRYGTGKFIRTAVEKPVVLKHVPRKFCRYGMPIDTFIQAITEAPNPDVILITSGMTYWYPGVQEAIRILNKQLPDIPIILGGIYATLCHDHALQNSGADYVIKGSGEIAALKLVDSLTGNKHDINNQCFEFPEPVYRYYKQLASVPIFTSIGCPYRCSFCASHLLSGKFRQKNPEKVVAEIEYYYHKRKVRHFAFFDDALLINADEHISVILNAIIEKKIHVNFHTPNGIHAQQISKDLANEMFKAKFKTIRLSYETSNLYRQQEMGFKITDNSLANAIDYLESAGFQRKELDVYVIMGLPEQTFEEVVTSMIFVAGLGAKVRLTSFSPIPGTIDWQRSIELYNMPVDIDPLLTNNSIFPLSRNDFTYEMFQKLRSLSKVINYSLDHQVNFFNESELAKIVAKSLYTKFKLSPGGI